MLCLGKQENKERQASVCLLHLIRSNWFWACAEKPLISSHIQPVIDVILDQLNTEGNVWQVQTLIIMLLSGFTSVNFLYLQSENLERIVSLLLAPLQSASNYEVMDSATDVFTYLLKASPHLRDNIPDYFTQFRKWLYKGATVNERIAGAKGLISIIMSTLIFDSVPKYISDCFEVLSDVQATDPTLQPVISQALSEFWNIHESNLTAEVTESLSPYRESMRPSYLY